MIDRRPVASRLARILRGRFRGHLGHRFLGSLPRGHLRATPVLPGSSAVRVGTNERGQLLARVAGVHPESHMAVPGRPALAQTRGFHARDLRLAHTAAERTPGGSDVDRICRSRRAAPRPEAAVLLGRVVNVSGSSLSAADEQPRGAGTPVGGDLAQGYAMQPQRARRGDASEADEPTPHPSTPGL